jgi:hypothetical protein
VLVEAESETFVRGRGYPEAVWLGSSSTQRTPVSAQVAIGVVVVVAAAAVIFVVANQGPEDAAGRAPGTTSESVVSSEDVPADPVARG